MIFGKNIFINPGVGVKDFSIHYSRDINLEETPRLLTQLMLTYARRRLSVTKASHMQSPKSVSSRSGAAKFN